MLKKIPVVVKVAVGAALITSAIVFVTYEDHHGADKYQRTCQEQVAKVPARAGEQNDSGAHECQDPKDYMPWWYVLVAWPEGIVAWALLATLGGILWQAKATQAAAQAQIDGNRAWIFADLNKLGGRIHSIKSLQENPLRTYLLASLHLRNEGLSPAWIDSVQGHMEILPRKQKPPKKVQFDLCPYISTLRVKGEEVFNPEFECLGNLTEETDWLYIWVLIKYHDGHGMQGETSLGYAMTLSGGLFRQTDLPDRNYNK